MLAKRSWQFCPLERKWSHKLLQNSEYKHNFSATVYLDPAKVKSGTAEVVEKGCKITSSIAAIKAQAPV